MAEKELHVADTMCEVLNPSQGERDRLTKLEVGEAIVKLQGKHTDALSAAVERMLKKARADRVGADAVRALQGIPEDIGVQLGREAVILAKHAQKKTVKAEDMRLAVSQLSKKIPQIRTHCERVVSSSVAVTPHILRTFNAS